MSVSRLVQRLVAVLAAVMVIFTLAPLGTANAAGDTSGTGGKNTNNTWGPGDGNGFNSVDVSSNASASMADTAGTGIINNGGTTKPIDIHGGGKDPSQCIGGGCAAQEIQDGVVPACGGSEWAYVTCSYYGSGWSYKSFPMLDNGRTFSAGSAYDPNALPLMVTIKIAGYQKTCPGPDSVTPAVIDPVTKKIITPEKRTPTTVECGKPDTQFDLHANPAVGPNVPAINNRTIAGPGLGGGDTCSSPYTPQDMSTGGPLLGNDGKPYTMAYVGYKVQWMLNSDSGGRFWDALETYECLPPAAAFVDSVPCYRVLKGTMDVYMPDPKFHNVDPTTGKVTWGRETAQTANIAGDYPRWNLAMKDQRLAYSRLADARDDAALKVCWDEKAQALKWNFDEFVGSWGWGKFDTRLSATYDLLKVITFYKLDQTGRVPKDVILWDRSSMYADHTNQISTWRDQTQDDPDIHWRTVTHVFCTPQTRDTNFSQIMYSNNGNTETYNAKGTSPVPAGLTYTANDCTAPQKNQPVCNETDGDCTGTNTHDAGWFCKNIELESWDKIATSARDLQSQADNKWRAAKWAPIEIASSGTSTNVRNVRNQTTTYKAGLDSSPRLTESDNVYNPTDQPFKFVPQLGVTTTGWGDEQRTLNSQFREASRDGKDFTLLPVYRFTADFRTSMPTSMTFNAYTGKMDVTSEETWVPSDSYCYGNAIAIDVLRVGSVPK